MQKYNKQ